MNDTICQNGVSSSHLSSHGNHRSIPNISSKRNELHGGCSSSSPNQPSAPYEPVSDHNAEKENERFQCRAVLLKLLQPPGSSVLHAQNNSCTLACQQTEKTLLKPDLCVSHCLRHAGSQQASRNAVDIDRKVNEEWTQKTRQCNENLSRKDSNRTSLPTITVRCQSCDARARPSYSEELQSRTGRCQYFPEDRQQYFNGNACFRKDTCDTKRAPYIAVQINGKLQRKDEDSPQQMSPPTWRYKGCNSSMCQLLPSNQTLQKSQPELGVTGASDRTILQNTKRLPDHLRGPAEIGKDSTYQIEEKTHQESPSSTQEKLEDHTLNSSPSYSMCSQESNLRREAICLSGEWSPPVVTTPNGQRRRHEERNVILEKTSERENQTVPHSPHESSSVIETQSDECTPIIVQCYSLSTASPTSKASLMSDSQFTKGQKHEASVHIRNVGVPTVSVSHSRSSYQQHSPRGLKSANRLQNNEEFVYDSPASSPRNIANLHSHNFTTQPNHTTDESSTSETGIDDEEDQTRSAMLPVRFHKSSAIPVGVPCLNCLPGHHASRRHHYLYNDPWTEPHLHPPQSGSHQKTRRPPDLHVGHESGGAFTNWHTRRVPSESKTALKIHDYYEERRILVGKFYQDIPYSVESSHCNRKSTSPYGRMTQLYQDDRCQSPLESSEIFHAQAGEEGCARQQEVAVGSRKRKSRQPRPQRVNTNDSALARKQYQQPIQHAEGRQEVSFHNRFHHHASSPFQPDASMSKEVHRIGRKDVAVCGNESDIYKFESTPEPTDQHESATRRKDHVLESNSSRPKICQSEIRSDTYSPWRPRSEQFFVYPRGPVPSYAPVDSHRRANHGPHEYQMKLYCQARHPNKYFSYSDRDVMEHPSDSSRYGNATERQRHAPLWRRTPENPFAAGSGYDGTQRSYSPPILASYTGPSERSLSTDDSHFERNAESSWSARGRGVDGEHRRSSLFYHAVPSKSKSPQHNSDEQSSLLSDQGCVSSTTVDDGADLHDKDDSDRSFQAFQASATTDGTNGPSKEQENLHTGEVWVNHVTPIVKERKFVCRYCSKKFAHFSTLQNHLRTHTGDKPFQCKFCSRRFAQSGVLKAHLRTHTGDKPFACMYCGKVFAQSTTLTNHLRTHTGQKPYVCQFCGKSFSQPSTLRKHELSHTKERPYPCKFCGKAFAQQSTLTNHLRSHTGQRPYKCHFCDKSFAQLSTLDRHLRLHSNASLKPYQCRHCSKSFSYFSNLSSHMQNHEQEQDGT